MRENELNPNPRLVKEGRQACRRKNSGKILAIFIVIIIQVVTKRGGHRGWIGRNLNTSKILVFWW